MKFYMMIRNKNKTNWILALGRYRQARFHTSGRPARPIDSRTL